MMFGLYEALITKVLWFGFPGSTGSIFGSVYGVAWGEFVALVLFWHPIMSFVLPIFIYEVLSGDFFPTHKRFLIKNWKTLSIIFLLLFIGANFQNMGATYNMLVSIGSVAGTIIIIFLLNRVTKTKNLESLMLGKKGMGILFSYLVILYILATVFILPERLPRTIFPYVFIALWYLVAIILLWSDTSKKQTTDVLGRYFTNKDLHWFVVLLLIFTLIFSVHTILSQPIIAVTFIVFMGAGIFIFILSILRVFQEKISQNIK
jgi:hypothetical protein